MPLPESGRAIREVVGGLEFLGAVILTAFLARAILSLRSDWGEIRLPRKIAAEGMIWSLDFKLSATLLKTLILFSWRQIAVFSAVLLIRIVLKREAVWVGSRASRREDHAEKLRNAG